MNPGTPKPRPKKARTAEPATESQSTFEQALAALEGIVQELERGELGLSDSLSRYEQGVKYLKHCYGQLSAAERRVALLKQLDSSGQAVTTPFDESAMSLEEKAASRGTRRSTARVREGKPRSPDAGGTVDGSAELF